ncbi:M15 family metallopeptidase [Nocardioides jishulii]|uniref:M15 family metallopeptidase n=1 Tax=Nocardioides jishulii TaxID=2575440 RepID=UPI0015861B15|nr:M15 family metallopeptidase [Nocardioides jishulii]
MRRREVTPAVRLGGIVLIGAMLAGCAGQDLTITPEIGEVRTSEPAAGGPGGKDPATTGSPAAPAVEPPPRLTERLLPADLLVQVERTLTADEIARVRRVAGIDHVTPLSLAQVSVQNRVLTLAAVDVSQYRRFTQRRTARYQAAWDRVAGGELAVDPSVPRRLWEADDHLRLGNDRQAPRVHIGATVSQVPQVDAVLNPAWGQELGMPADNALLISTSTTEPRVVRPRVERVLRRLLGEKPSVQVQVLGQDRDLTAVQSAYLTGGSVALGSFTYRVLEDGRISPDPAWVAESIVTDEVPILGQVTCHRVVMPQLRAALAEIRRAGLAAKINVAQYGGCFNPRFMADAQSLSLHAFGIALDLNVPGNQRGTVGTIDRQVVSIFERWGFAWGGRWAWTDPMHFEMDRLVAAR